jgi:hypothetical protein
MKVPCSIYNPIVCKSLIRLLVPEISKSPFVHVMIKQFHVAVRPFYNELPTSTTKCMVLAYSFLKHLLGVL